MNRLESLNGGSPSGSRFAAAYTWPAIGLIGAVALIHLIDAPEYYGEVPYIGILFVVSAVAAIVAAVGIVRNQRWGWQLGAAVSAGTAVGYVLSRTVGIPMFRENDLAHFLEPIGIASLVVEVAFLVVAWQALSSKRPVS